MYKKFFSLLMVFCLAAGLLFNKESSIVSASSVSPIDTACVKAALLCEVSSGKTLYEYNCDEELAIAGLSKLPALLIICEAFDEGIINGETIVTVGDKSASIKGTTAFLTTGEQMNAGDLLMAAVMINAGDAIHALACTAYGSESVVAEKINSRMAELGVSVQYTDICGDEVHLSASELARIGSEILKSEAYKNNSTLFYESIEHSTGAGKTELANPNKLVKQYSGCLGIATGSSNDAGYCGIFAAERGDTAYIAVVIGAANGGDRFGAGIDLLDYGFASARCVTVIKKGDTAAEIPVTGGLEKKVALIAETDAVLLLNVSDAAYFTENLYPETMEAPIAKGMQIGSIRYTDANGSILGEVQLVADRDIGVANLTDYIKIILRHWLNKI